MPSNRLCSVYVLAETPSGPVKIGHAEDPILRRNQLQSGNPRRLTLVREFPCVDRAGAIALETTAHTFLAGLRIGGEWFDIEASSAVAAVTACIPE